MYLRLERLGKKFEATEAVREFSLDVEGGEMLSLPGPSGCGKTIDQLSGGEQQRVALARALNVRPKVLLLDEPLRNLDAKLRVRMRGEIRRLQREFGITALYVTHDQEKALALSDRVAVMEGGRIVEADGRPTIRTAISSIYKERWEIELFFKTLKQNLKVKTFIGTSKNALRIQIWTAGLEMLKRHLRNKCY